MGDIDALLQLKMNKLYPHKKALKPVMPMDENQ